MNTPAKTNWRIAGEEFGSCNCAWGCPCQFMALPTYGNCEGLTSWQIREGYFGDTRLDGVLFAEIDWWPGPIHDGNGIRQLVIDEQTTPDQRVALTAIWSGVQGGAVFEILAAVCPKQLETVVAPITLQIDRERRHGVLRIPGIGETHAEPIKNPVSGEEHRARIVLPGGFEFEEAEMANAVSLSVQTGDIAFQHENVYSQLNEFDWSNA